MKITYISNSTIPSRAANSIHVMKMCQAFAQNGHEVFLLAPDKKKDAETGISDIFEYYGISKQFIIKHLPCPAIRGRDWIYAAFVRQTLKKIKPDLVYGRHLMGCTQAARNGYRVMYELHFPVWERSKRDHDLFREIITSTDFCKLVVITNALKKICIEQGFLPANKILVAPDGADRLHDFSSLPEWQGRENVLQIGYVGHLYSGRGIDLILALAEKLDAMDFHLIGGTPSDIDYWKTQTIRTNVFFHGYITPNLVYKYRNSCDILLAPYQETLTTADDGPNTSKVMSPLKIFEYMSSRKSIIASDLPALREVLNQDNAVLVRPNSIEDWRKAIERLQESKVRTRIADRAYEDFCAHYTWENRARSILSHTPYE